MVQGLASLNRKLKATIPNSVRKAAVLVLEENAREIVAEMRRLAPKGESLNLLSSIGWTWGDAPAGTLSIGTVGNTKYSAMRITIYAGGDDAFYAKFQEFGTKKMAPNPFFFPSYRKLRRKVRGRVTRKINKAIKSL